MKERVGNHSSYQLTIKWNQTMLDLILVCDKKCIRNFDMYKKTHMFK